MASSVLKRKFRRDRLEIIAAIVDGCPGTVTGLIRTCNLLGAMIYQENMLADMVRLKLVSTTANTNREFGSRPESIVYWATELGREFSAHIHAAKKIAGWE